MESTKKLTSGSSSSSSFVDLFGPKDSSALPSSSSSTGLFNSVFGPPSTGLGRDFSRPGISRPSTNRNSSSQYGSPITQDYRTPKGNSNSPSIPSKDRSTNYQNETVEPCYFSSSIHYGGQEVYSPNIQSTNTYNNFKRDGKDDDSNGSNSNSASRGNWWQGSLYY